MGDGAFSGSIPQVYDRCLGPMLFRPYAVDLTRRLAALPARDVLELACGTGIVTAEVARVLPADTRIVATDLNQAMLGVAVRATDAPNVTFQQVDAQSPPFDDDSFDAVYCQFGVMFFPDKGGAYAEMQRVLRPGGTLLFSVWDRIETSPIVHAVGEALARCFPDDPPQFISRVPHGYHDTAAIRDALEAAGFGQVVVDAVTLPSRAPSARDVAVGLCQGTPIRHEITTRDPERLQRVTDAVTEAVAGRFGAGEVRADMRAYVVTATG